MPYSITLGQAVKLLPAREPASARIGRHAAKCIAERAEQQCLPQGIRMKFEQTEQDCLRPAGQQSSGQKTG